MDFWTRRRFLLASGVTGAGGLAAAGIWYPLRDVLSTAGEMPAGARTLVVVTLYGGNDGLNTVIPYADPAYEKARPELAYTPDEVLKLDAATGLNPALKGMHGLFGAKRLAIVRGVGYPRADRSHFRSMDIWHTAQPQRPGTTGWVGRWLDSVGGDPRLAVSCESVLPPMMAGASSAAAVVGTGGLKLPRRFPVDTISALGAAATDESPLQARAASCFADLVDVHEFVHDVEEAAEELAESGDEPTATRTGGQTALDRQLDLVAQCVEARVATKVFSVSLGGFDTHADEKRPHQALLSMLDRAVTAFLERMSRSEHGRGVAVVIYSEFGRRVRANASDGTDHGTASDVFVAGHGIRGGLYGEPPSLTDLDNGDLKFTTDFRDIYATLLDQALDADPARLLDGWQGRLPQII